MNKMNLGIKLGLLALLFHVHTPVEAYIKKHRMIILADMGNEADEFQQNIHLLMYANEIDIEGLLAVTGVFWKKPPAAYLYSDSLISGYAKVWQNLSLHAPGWPTPEYLKSIAGAGQTNYGIDGVDTVKTSFTKSSFGSQLILNAAIKNDPRPINIIVNAGSNTLAQALMDYEKTHTEAELAAFVAKFRVYENGAQDDAGAWILSRYPTIHWIRSNYQTYAHMGGGENGDGGPVTWQPFSNEAGKGQKEWFQSHVQTNHGEFGKLYPDRIWKGSYVDVEGGGTTPWIGLVNHGLYDPEPGRQSWGGWGGRFTNKKLLNYFSRWNSSQNLAEIKRMPFYCYGDSAKDSWVNREDGKSYSSVNTPVYRWRRAYANDLRGRMDWCVKPFNQANHNPKAAFNGDTEDSIVIIQAKPSESINLDASASTDPDNDPLLYEWYVYSEAGTYPGRINIPNSNKVRTTLTLPADADAKQIHIILEVRDSSKVTDASGVLSMYDYRRIVINISANGVSVPSRPLSQIPWAVIYRKGYLLFKNVDPNIHSVDLYNIEGRKVFKGKIVSGRTLITALDAGMYFVRVGASQVGRIILP